VEPQYAILIGAALATCGWLYGARRARSLSRKQHTINVMLQANLNKEFRAAQKLLGEAIDAGKCPDLRSKEYETLRDAFRMVANHYEFISAGLRNGDLEENLIRDSQRGQMLRLYSFCKDFIWNLRDARNRLTIYEHFEWLNGRWAVKPPGRVQKIVETCMGRPFAGKRVNPHG
jgi:hypothetical protein